MARPACDGPAECLLGVDQPPAGQRRGGIGHGRQGVDDPHPSGPADGPAAASLQLRLRGVASHRAQPGPLVAADHLGEAVTGGVRGRHRLVDERGGRVQITGHRARDGPSR